MAQHRWERCLKGATQHVLIGVADADRRQPHDDLALAGIIQGYRFDGEWLVEGAQHRRAGRNWHGRVPSL
jgi:hypothetical protein